MFQTLTTASFRREYERIIDSICLFVFAGEEDDDDDEADEEEEVGDEDEEDEPEGADEEDEEEDVGLEYLEKVIVITSCR